MISAARLLVVAALGAATAFALAACTDGTTPNCSGDAAASCGTEVPLGEGGTGEETGAPDTGADSSAMDATADAHDGARPADAGGQ